MPVNPFARQMATEERRVSENLSQQLTRALRTSRIQVEASANTLADERRPSRYIQRLYEGALRTALRPVQRNHRYMTLETSLDIERATARRMQLWQATVTVTARFATQTRGGGSYCLSDGDTLWSVAQQYYGHGAYFVAIADANPRTTGRQHSVLISGANLRIPDVEVVTEARNARNLGAIFPSTPPAPARRVARRFTSEWPTVTVGMDKAGEVEFRECVGGVRLVVKFSLIGSLSASREGELDPVSFDNRSYKSAIEREINNITTNFSIRNFTTARLTISNSVLGGQWTASYSLETDGTLRFRIAPRSVRQRSGPYSITGGIGFQVSIRVEGSCETQQRAPSRQQSTSTNAQETVQAINQALQVLAGVGIACSRIPQAALVLAGSVIDPNATLDSHGRIRSGRRVTM